MCPSDIYQLPVSSQGYGPEAEVYASDLQFPCSIAVKDQELSGEVRIQIMIDDKNTWTDYEEGQIILGKKIKCRLATLEGETRTIAIEVFHT